MNIKEYAGQNYIQGNGIEIGALHQPFPVSAAANVKYLDRMPNEKLREHYPELSHLPLTKIDIIDDAATLATLADNSQDFVIASDIIEHLPDPILAVKNMLRVLRPNGVLLLAIPDKHYSFDLFRPVTPTSHLIKDHLEGPSGSKADHFAEWVRYVDRIRTPAEFKAQYEKRVAEDYAIHYHVWTQFDILEFLVLLRREFNQPFIIEAVFRHTSDVLIVAYKTDIPQKLDELSALSRKVDALKCAPEQVYELKMKIGKTFFSMGNWLESVWMFKEAGEAVSNQIEPWLLSARANLEAAKMTDPQGKPYLEVTYINDAREMLEKARKLDPSNLEYLKLLETVKALPK